MTLPVCIGHSHLNCVIAAAQEQQRAISFVSLWNAASFEGGKPDGRLAAPALALLCGGPVVSLIGGAAQYKLAMVRHPIPFDVILPEEPHLPRVEHARVLPCEGLRGALVEASAADFRLMREVRRVTPGPLFQCQTPPPCGDNARLEADVPWQFFHGRREITSRWLRLKIWRLYSAVVREFCEAEGIGFLPVPAGATDPEGFLREECYRDANHANDRYGELLLAQMADLVTGL